MDDIELRNIEPNQPLIRTLTRSESFCQEERIDTEYGTVVVAVHGEKTKPAFLTYHDIGLNHISNFQAFFNFVDTRILMQSFTVYHVNAPGQEEGAPTLPESYVYPTMDQLAEILLPVMKFFGIKHFVGLGVGAGANVLSRFALQYPDYVDGLFLVNPTCTVSSWAEWGYQKLNAIHLRSSGMTASTQDYLMWHHFGRMYEERSHDLTVVYRNYFSSSVNPYNLSLFIDSFIKRTDLGIVREMDPEKRKTVKNFSCPVLLICGDLSPHLEDSVTMNSRLDPTKSTWMKLSGCGMVLEEEPAKVSEALRYFLEGLGYALNQFRRPSSASTASTEAVGQSLHKSPGSSPSSSPVSSEVDVTTHLKLSQQCKQRSTVNASTNKESWLETTLKAPVHIVENPINNLDVPC